MQTRQSQGIKEIIKSFPAVAEILQEYGIECGTCSVGICQLKDVLEIHSLPEDQARSLMARIETILFGDTINSDLVTESTVKPCPNSTDTLSDAVVTLIKEHTFIKRFISIAPCLTSKLDLTKQSDRVLAENCLEFITCYADKLHHGKEEEILFRYFDTSEEIFQAMFDEHTQGRKLVRLMRNDIVDKKTDAFTAHFQKYHDLLNEHIYKEDTILFPWLDRRMTDDQKEEMNFKFLLSEKNSDIDSKKFEAFVQELEAVMLNNLPSKNKEYSTLGV